MMLEQVHWGELFGVLSFCGGAGRSGGVGAFGATGPLATGCAGGYREVTGLGLAGTAPRPQGWRVGWDRAERSVGSGLGGGPGS